jgi:hypothetical protein
MVDVHWWSGFSPYYVKHVHVAAVLRICNWVVLSLNIDWFHSGLFNNSKTNIKILSLTHIILPFKLFHTCSSQLSKLGQIGDARFESWLGH